MQTDYRGSTQNPFTIFMLGILSGWMLSAFMRSVKRHHHSPSTSGQVAGSAKSIRGPINFPGTMFDTFTTMSTDAANLFAPAQTPSEAIHDQYLAAYNALNDSLMAVARKKQTDATTDYSTLINHLLDQMIALSEDVFQKVLAMPDVKAAIVEITRRTSTLKSAAAEMPKTTEILTQGNKVVTAATSVASFATGLG
jgi:hypothetical protein